MDNQPGRWTRSLEVDASGPELALSQVFTILVAMPQLHNLTISHHISLIELALLATQQHRSLRQLSVAYCTLTSPTMISTMKTLSCLGSLERLHMSIDENGHSSQPDTTFYATPLDGFHLLRMLSLQHLLIDVGSHDHSISMAHCQWLFQNLQEFILDHNECDACLVHFVRMTHRLPQLHYLELSDVTQDGVALFFQPMTLQIYHVQMDISPQSTCAETLCTSVQVLTLKSDLFDGEIASFLDAVISVGNLSIKSIQIAPYYSYGHFTWMCDNDEDVDNDVINCTRGALLTRALLLRKKGVELLDEKGMGVFMAPSSVYT